MTEKCSAFRGDLPRSGVQTGLHWDSVVALTSAGEQSTFYVERTVQQWEKKFL